MDPTKTPYQYTWKLYVMHLFFTFTSRMWDMGIVFLIAELTNNSLSLVAYAGLCNNLFLVLFMTTLGNFLDRTNRLAAAEIALTVKFITLTSAYTICAYLTYEHSHQQSNLIYLIPILSAIASLSFSTISQSVEKDWIVVLANGDSSWLSTTNSIMTQIDSGVNSFAPAITGFMFVYLSMSTAAMVLLCINAIATLFLYIFMYYLYHSWPALSVRSTRAVASSNSYDDTFSAAATVDRGFISFFTWGIFDDFLTSGCAGAMISYAFLYLTVLSFGSLMTVYLRWAGVSDGMIGVSRGAAAFTGLMGAVIFPFVNSCLGLYWTSVISIIYQCILVGFAAASFYLFDMHTTVLVLIVAVLFSRTGLWMFDLGVRQICQETIPEHCRGKVNGQWRSMTAFFEMSSYILACLVPDPQHFKVLTTVSALMVFLATVTFIMNKPGLGDSHDDREMNIKYQPVNLVEMKEHKKYNSIDSKR